MAESRDNRLKANAAGEGVHVIRNALHEHSVAAEIQARAIAERDAKNLDLQQQNADYKRQITELSNVSTRQQIGQGMARVYEGMIQQTANGTPLLSLPATPLNPMTAAGTSYRPVSASDRIEGTYERKTLQMYSDKLSDHVVGQGALGYLLGEPQAVTLSNEMVVALREWQSSIQSEILCVAGPNELYYPSKMSALAATMVKLYTEAKPLVVLNFCDQPNPKTIEDGKSVEEAALISMVYNMIQQLVDHVPPQFDSPKDLTLKRFTALDGSVSSLDAALELFKDLIPLSLPYIVFIVDGIEWLDYRKGQKGCKDFVNALWQLKTMRLPADEPQCVYKVLFTTASMPGCLMQTLDVSEIQLQDDLIE